MKRRVKREEHEAVLRDYQALREQFTTMHEVFGRTIQAIRSISFDASEPVVTGEIKWAQVRTEAGTTEMSVWFEALPSEESESEHNE